MLDNKFGALEGLVKELSSSNYPPVIVKKMLTILEKSAIKYVLEDLPDNESVTFYNKKLDEHIVKELKL